MFGPNPKAKIGESGTHHHRHPIFRQCLNDLQMTFHSVFPSTRDFDLLFITGSGTLANEMLIESYRGCVTADCADGEFGRRLASMCSERFNSKDPTMPLACIYPVYETSISRLNPPIEAHRFGSHYLVFADMVSAFPYYGIPENVDCFTTVSSKQIGAFPVISIIGIRKSFKKGLFKKSKMSVLSLMRCFDFMRKHEPPFTAAVPLYYDLLDRLQSFDPFEFNGKINRRRNLLENAFRLLRSKGQDIRTLGSGPVITLEPNKATDSWGIAFDLYHSPAGYQIFLWSGKDEDYNRFAESICG